jgi:hypothetical protein
VIGKNIRSASLLILRKKASFSTSNDVVSKIVNGFGDSFQSIFPWQDYPCDIRKAPLWIDTAVKGADPNWVKQLKKFVIDMAWTFSPVVTNCLDDKDVIVGGKEAFRAASAAIFDQFSPSSIANNKPLTNKYDKMNAVFDEKLHEFFQTSIETFLAKNGSTSKLNYSLEDVQHVEISNKEVIFGASRGMAIGDKILRKKILYGLFSAFIPSPEEKGLQLNHNIVTIRYSLDVVCKELFNVTNLVTGEITQGDTEPVTRTHRVLLENSITFSRLDSSYQSELNDDWSIVDIDYWLEGNPFWIKEGKDNRPLSPPS